MIEVHKLISDNNLGASISAVLGQANVIRLAGSKFSVHVELDNDGSGTAAGTLSVVASNDGVNFHVVPKNPSWSVVAATNIQQARVYDVVAQYVGATYARTGGGGDAHTALNVTVAVEVPR